MGLLLSANLFLFYWFSFLFCRYVRQMRNLISWYIFFEIISRKNTWSSSGNTSGVRPHPERAHVCSLQVVCLLGMCLAANDFCSSSWRGLFFSCKKKSRGRQFLTLVSVSATSRPVFL